MMRRIGLIATVALLFVASAPAQVAVYVTSSSSRFSNVESGEIITYETTGNIAADQFDNFWTSGIGGGASLRFLSLGLLNLSLDLRGSTRPGTPGADTALGGIKLGIQPPFLRLKPYLQASGGYLGTRTVNENSTGTYPYPPVGGTLTNHYAGWEILGGVDYPLIRVLDLRLIEVGAGRGYSTSAPSITALTINTGMVFHF